MQWILCSVPENYDEMNLKASFMTAGGVTLKADAVAIDAQQHDLRKLDPSRASFCRESFGFFVKLFAINSFPSRAQHIKD